VHTKGLLRSVRVQGAHRPLANPVDGPGCHESGHDVGLLPLCALAMEHGQEGANEHDTQSGVGAQPMRA
jgi:hypothetical protein